MNWRLRVLKRVLWMLNGLVTLSRCRYADLLWCATCLLIIGVSWNSGNDKILTAILLAPQHIFCHVHGPILKDACHKWTLHVTGFNILQWSQDVFSAEDMSLLFFSADESRRKFRKIQNSYSKSSRSFFSSERKWTNIFLALNIL